MHRIALPAHDAAAAAHVVGDHEIALLVRQFEPRMVEDVAGLGSKSDDEPRPVRARPGNGRENVRIFDEMQVRRRRPDLS